MLSSTTNSAAALADASEVVIVVPLYVDNSGVPDFSMIDAATTAVGSALRPGVLVCYETTVPVGTTRGRFKTALEEASGLICGRDFNLVFSPERVSSGRVFADLRRYPKLVGGVTPQCGKRASRFYASVLEFDERPDLPRPNGVWDLGSCEASELAKLAETTYRDVNIALANQFAKFSSKHEIDIHSVIEACNSQPFSHIHQPGIAVGGHCIPVYPQMYLWNDPDASVVRAGRSTNASMPEHYIATLEREHGSLRGETVLVLGAAYRGGVKETAFSGVFPVVEALHSRGALCYVTDPLYTANELEALGLPTKGNSSDVTVIVIQTDHAEYSTYDFLQHPRLRTILNGRSDTRHVSASNVRTITP
jgi:nucleotide sugar dehydrogenase